MWTPWIRLNLPRIEIPDLETPSAETVVDRITNFIIQYPVPVVAFVFGIAIVVGWERWRVFKGILIGSALVIAAMFLLRAVQ